jgi:hypothetical protein
MSFLDNNGLSTFYNNLKKQFPQKFEASYSVVRATAQGNGSITFTCDSTPSSPITLTILILNKGGISV